MANESAGPVRELVDVIAALREHCPWMRALTHESLVEYLIEETYEVVESIEAGNEEELRSELGDVLLQVALHARLAEENGGYAFDDVARGITAKMIRRNPHVFKPDGTLQETFPATVEEIEQKWDAVKRAENPGRTDPFQGIPSRLPALAQAQKSLDRAARAGSRQARPGVVETPTSEEELGELLLSIVAAGREKGFDAERALRGALRRYQLSYRDPT